MNGQNFRKSQSKKFMSFGEAKEYADSISKVSTEVGRENLIGNRVRIRLRADETFDVVTYVPVEKVKKEAAK